MLQGTKVPSFPKNDSAEIEICGDAIQIPMIMQEKFTGWGGMSPK
jgi:hypothetical protein